jgi:hypothetical protein
MKSVERCDRLTKIIEWKETHNRTQPNCNSSDAYEKQLGIWLNRFKTLNRLGKMPPSDIEFIKNSACPDLLQIVRDPVKNFEKANWSNVYNKRDEKFVVKLKQAMEYHIIHGKFPEYYDYVSIMSNKDRYPKSVEFMSNPDGFRSWHETEQLNRVTEIINYCVANDLVIPASTSTSKIERQYNRFIVYLRKGEGKTHQSVLDYIKQSERPNLLQSGVSMRVKLVGK